MGQKSNPIGLRLGINKNWDSIWFDEKNFADRIKEDLVIEIILFQSIKLQVLLKLKLKGHLKELLLQSIQLDLV